MGSTRLSSSKDGATLGSRLGPYVLERELGRGGMAVVYEGVHGARKERVAIKVVGDALGDDPTALARFAREAKVLAKLRHPHIVAASELATSDGRAYFVMELLEGPTLAAHLRAREGERLSLAEIVGIFVPIAAAVAAAHAGGVVHRDLKPSNVLLARRPSGVHPTVLDFGISTSVGGEEEQTLTRTGAVLGTVSYLSPEQTRGARYATAQSDQYALGAMLYECATGALPFRRESAYETMHAIVTEDVRPPSDARPDLPPAFDAIVLRAMQRDAAARFSSVAALGLALLALADEGLRARWRDELGATVPVTDASVAASPDVTLTDGIGIGDARVSRTPAPEAPAPPPAPPAPSVPPSRRWLAALLVLAASAGVAGSFARRRARSSEPARPLDPTVAALAGSDARVACPIFEVHGVRDAEVRLGAAAASVACARVRWNLGGSDDRVLPPAALLGLPRQPVEGFRDPYVTGEQREATRALARARGAAYLDGVVTNDQNWLVELALRSPDDRAIASGQARDATFLAALKTALFRLWLPPLALRAIDPDVARWTSLPDVETGIAQTNAAVLDSARGMRGDPPPRGRARERTLRPPQGVRRARLRAAPGRRLSGVGRVLPPALATSIEALFAWGVPIPVEEERSARRTAGGAP